ncbi:Co-chaperone Hsc20 [Apiospora arundinis]
MRSSLLPRRRPLERICDACKQQRREWSSTSASRLVYGFNKLTSSPFSNLTSIPRRSKAPAATSSSSLLSTRAAFSSTRNIQAGEAASRKPIPEQQQQQQSSSPSSREAVVPPTHYELFPDTLPAGPPPHGPFAVDTSTLRREFLRLQAKAHPDMHPQHHKNRAEAASARINEAFKTLTNPLLRAQYLLELAGRADNASSDESAKVEDPELLMEVLEARELIEEAGSEEELKPLHEENAARERRSEEVLARCFAEGDLEGAAHEAVRLRYWVNIRESIEGWERGKPVVLEH